MKGSYLIIALVLFFGGYALKVLVADAQASKASTARVEAQRLIAFSGFVREHRADGNTLPPGVAPNTAVPVPSWFQRDTRLFVAVDGSKEYVFAAYETLGEAAGVLKALDTDARWGDERLLVGRSEGGRLYTLRNEGGPAELLPASIPEAAVVIPITM